LANPLSTTGHPVTLAIGGVASSDAVPVVVTVAGHSNPAVPMAVR
jgi:hypothetical protein